MPKTIDNRSMAGGSPAQRDLGDTQCCHIRSGRMRAILDLRDGASVDDVGCPI
jgi:hypothetical protein